MRMADFPDMDMGFRLMSLMQFLTSYDVVASVGGIMQRVASSTNGFAFVPDVATVGPDQTEVTATSFADGGMKVRLEVPDGVHPAGYSYLVVPGEEPTPCAVAMFIPQTGRGLLFSTSWSMPPVRAGRT